ncbi:proteasome subunit beta [Mycobacteroides salmoniphilum]|uniref:Proteasome subunit beta n=1 Tax=Mycobacteroides salmoniphilum TaxID=404941 RepID=A0A4R8SUQ9_9MYCO|nr:proteasome subunit beta [Mycobacteroides salmoniphilum]TDZ89624.1 Proteasome subunit beta precursor [Mycobacteroides salmoniphilum]TEA04206.1 Proteasome subunit beta precursor [Mycobacteroides salmoniphilum]
MIWRDDSIAPQQFTRHSHLSSFSEYLRIQAPELLPAVGKASSDVIANLPHGTTIVALTYSGGVLIAGDRRATQGNYIANRDIDKVQITDNYSATGIAGTAAIAVEFARLYAVELEHYEKLEGVPLTFNGKANRLSALVRGNLAAAMQGLVAVPLLVGYDIDDPNGETAGRIVSFDVAGGWHVESDGYQAVGSGSMFAKSSIKKLYKPGGDALGALAVAVESLYDAAEDDSATGGPDLVRRVFPTAVRIDSGGAVRVPEADIERIAREVIEKRTEAARAESELRESGGKS